MDMQVYYGSKEENNRAQRTVAVGTNQTGNKDRLVKLDTWNVKIKTTQN